MTVLRPGMRVRLVARMKPEHEPRTPCGVAYVPKRPPTPPGTEGTVMAVDVPPPPGFVTPLPLIGVRFDGAAHGRGVYAYMIEPIDDGDGRQVVTWDSCPWQPAQVRA